MSSPPSSASEQEPATAVRPAGPVRRIQAVAGMVAVAVVCLQQPAGVFAYDAASYWGGATALLDGGDVFERGLLAVRGVLTSFLYLPAAAVVHLAGDSSTGPAVLVENAVLLALIGAFLLPRLVGVWREVTPVVVWVSTAGSAVLLGGFAPFPLTDLWAAALLLAAGVALDGPGRWRLLLSGFAAGLAFHLRPAALIPVAGLLVVVLVARHLSGLMFPAGIALALLPQFALNSWRGGSWLPWPEATAGLTQLQAGYAAYVVRYDTVMSGPVSDPRRFFCSPGMATALDGRAPGSTGELAGAFLAHLPRAIVLSAQKVAASLHWPLATPYYEPAAGVNVLFALLVTATVVVGAAALLWATVQRGRGSSLGMVGTGVTFVASMLTLATSATETRFALPLVLCGIAGCASLVDRGLRLPRTRSGRSWFLGSLLAVLVVFGVGVSGLQHPVEGDVTLAGCVDP